MFLKLKGFRTLSIAIFSLITIIFIRFCHQIYQKNYPQFDNYILLFLEKRQNPLLNSSLIKIYQISGAYITGAIVFGVLSFLIWRKYWHQATGFVIATLGILILVDQILKPFFDRRRPPKPRLVEDLSRDCFPSGHAAGNLVLYFYLSFIIAAKYPQLKIYIYTLATIIVIFVGFASVYTKAHWASDILGGYFFGYVWLIFSLNCLKFLENKY